VQELDRHVYERWSGKAGAHGFGSSVEEELLCRAGARKHVHAGGATATAAGLVTVVHGRCKQDAMRAKERAWLGRARMELRCGSSEQARTEGSEAAHSGSLARAAAEGPATRQGRNGARVRHQVE
jgi:hypothetical protein